MNELIIKNETGLSVPVNSNPLLAEYKAPQDFVRLTPRAAIVCLSNIRNREALVRSVQNNETPTLSTLNKELGQEKVIAYITLWINDLNKALTLKRDMEAAQVRECAFYLYEDYYCATIADFKLFFSNVKKGLYGEMYESLSMAKLLGLFKAFFRDRENAVYEANIQEDRARFGCSVSSEPKSCETYSIEQYKAVIGQKLKNK